MAPNYFKSRTFSGRPKFDFVVFYMKFGVGSVREALVRVRGLLLSYLELTL